MKPEIIAPVIGLLLAGTAIAADWLEEFKNPPREFSVMPFWFWNDTLEDKELVRQIADFEAHGVYGFVIHPRIGLPQDTGWMSPKMIHAMNQLYRVGVRAVRAGIRRLLWHHHSRRLY